MMAFDPSEARDRRGKWTKLAQAIKKLSEADHTTVANAIGELPKGGHGNRASIRGVEIRRHQSGAVNVKIGGESRQYASHEDVARAVIRREHGMPSTGTGKPFLAERIASKQGVDVQLGMSGNYRVTKNGSKRLGIIVKDPDGTYSYEHKRGDRGYSYKTLDEAVAAMDKRDRAGESIGGRGETMRQYAGIGSAADERAAVRRRQVLEIEMLQRKQQRRHGPG